MGKICWTKPLLEEAVKNSVSKFDAIRKLGMNPHGSYRTITKYIAEFNLDTSHWVGEVRTYNWSRSKIPDDEIFTSNSLRERKDIKRRIIQGNLIEYKCKECSLIDSWNGKSLSLHLDHINGNPTDNRLENLRFLCPNCHSQTETYCGKKRKRGSVATAADS